MKGVVRMQLWQFGLIYLLLLVVLFVMKSRRIHQTKLLLLASFRMTLQLVIAGLVLTYIFEHPHPVFPVLYFISMTVFAIHRVVSKNPGMGRGFYRAVGGSLGLSGLFVVVFFVALVAGQSVFNAQYMIPISGMIMGNAMTGTSLGVKTFRESFQLEHTRIETLINIGANPDEVLLPLVNQSLETALLPTLNNMLGMGIVALPGMMTGQILSGTLPTTAILYQIAIMIAITTVVCLSVFGSLWFGYRSLINDRQQIVERFLQKKKP
ncbi:YbbM seven transmembrane helix protein [Clostridiaceae bacterium JG1575]|nr:YbbM seven transmembrane helix protein [Clostridiaceae bacterium JG1575]